MYKIQDITRLHLEVSTLCNARCPQCPRNFRGYPYNDGYPETNLTLEQVLDLVLLIVHGTGTSTWY